MTTATPDTPLPPLVLVVSDLHLTNGRDPVTGRVHPRENFLADEAFARFLAHHRPPDGEPRLLVINGDSLDFLRITSYPKSPADFARWREDLARLDYHPKRPLEHTLVRKERRYGLRTDHYKTVYKFREIVRGHPVFFRALGDWVAAGGRLVFLKGNHDLEFHWELLHRAIREELATTAGDLARGPAIAFHEDCWQLHNLYFEHGHRFEPATRVEGEPTIFRGEEIRFPFGSMFNKYLINQLEALEPWLDNVKPRSRMIKTAIRRRPITALAILLHAFRALRPLIIRESLKNGMAMLLLIVTIGVPLITLLLVGLSFLVPAVHDGIVSVIANQTLRRVLSVLGVALPWLVNGIRELRTRRRAPEHGEDEYGEGVYHALAPRVGRFRTMYGVVGHTHRMDVQDLGAIGSTRCLYLNSGSWAPRWDEHRPDQTGWVEYSFLRFRLEGGEYAHECLEWRDDRDAPGTPIMIGPAD